MGLIRPNKGDLAKPLIPSTWPSNALEYFLRSVTSYSRQLSMRGRQVWFGRSSWNSAEPHPGPLPPPLHRHDPSTVCDASLRWVAGKFGSFSFFCGPMDPWLLPCSPRIKPSLNQCMGCVLFVFPCMCAKLG
jgi:hypothetical protein